jgi:hypothetical protein
MPDFEVNEGYIEAGRARAGCALPVIGGFAVASGAHRTVPDRPSDRALS